MKSVVSAILFILMGYSLVSCGFRQTSSQSETTAAVPAPAPPTPPTAAELQKPPAVMLEKPLRDPFVSLKSAGGPVSGAPSSPAGAGGGYSVSGVIVDRRPSAILEEGSNSYIVHVGDRVEGYTVGSITLNNVVLLKGKEKLMLPVQQGK